MFFPDEKLMKRPSKRLPWSVFWLEPGYIWEYHRLMKGRMSFEAFEAFEVTN